MKQAVAKSTFSQASEEAKTTTKQVKGGAVTSKIETVPRSGSSKPTSNLLSGGGEMIGKNITAPIKNNIEMEGSDDGQYGDDNQ